MTTLEVKSGYGLDAEQELHQLELLERSRAITPIGLVISFLGAHVVPAGVDADAYTDEVLAMLARGARAGHRGVSRHHRASAGCSRPRRRSTHVRALRASWASRPGPTPTRGRAREGWETAVAGGAISAEHLTYTPDEEIREVGETDTIAVLLPQAELVYMTDRRANARLFIDHGRAGGGRHRLLLVDPRHVADLHDRAGRAVVSDHRRPRRSSARR